MEGSVVVIGDGHGISPPGLPDKADTILVVDAEAVLAAPVAPQQFQSIARVQGQFIQLPGLVDIIQLAPGRRPQVLRAGAPGRRAVDAVGYILRSLIRKSLNHPDILTGGRVKVNRWGNPE